MAAATFSCIAENRLPRDSGKQAPRAAHHAPIVRPLVARVARERRVNLLAATSDHAPVTTGCSSESAAVVSRGLSRDARPVAAAACGRWLSRERSVGDTRAQQARQVAPCAR
eukprot:CAMPEP_0206632630 /NCGR_PEP_ID=MMETSP0325_2-20121206/69006_1 /ASSEMBLY_ACC=CAM_ASM_000347 /TAXON_ID=2866 /ORGANISM="Crypthecodinium cohnii, Strain Seligo" /LENGTH=111 /DNA_ID=CAMNT_0054158163 /DNA_START=412 /DNA_END=748 /DNA_ORIENTATION=-